MPEQQWLIETVRALHVRRTAALQNLVIPARAAANQMMDAGMRSGADPLKAALFEIDSVEQELSNLVAKDPEAFVKLVIAGLLKQK